MSIRNAMEFHPKLCMNLRNDDYKDILMILALIVDFFSRIRVRSIRKAA